MSMSKKFTPVEKRVLDNVILHNLLSMNELPPFKFSNIYEVNNEKYNSSGILLSTHSFIQFIPLFVTQIMF